MLALLLVVLTTSTGALVAAALKVECGAFIRAGISIAIGQALLLWLPFLAAAAFDLSARDAGLAALGMLSCVCASALAFKATRTEQRAWLSQLLTSVREPRNAPLVAVGGGFIVLLTWLHHTHYLMPRPDGLHSAGVTWGDLPIHLALVSRFSHAEGLAPLHHPLFLNGPLTYPFLPDYSVAVLTALGLPLRFAFIVGGMCPLAGLMLLIHGVTTLWIAPRRAHVSALAITLFFLAGGLGFGAFAMRWLEGAPILKLLATTNATYDITPHILKAGHIGNLFLGARSACYGMPIGLLVVLLLGHEMARGPAHGLAHGTASGPPSRASLIVCGLAVGSLPLVHSHSFLVAAGVVGFYMLLRWRWRASWAVLLGVMLLVALPQLLWLTGSGERSFVRLAGGFLRPAPSALDWALDIGMGVGTWLLLVPLAVLFAAPRARRLTFPLLMLLPVANLITFTPAVYDNVKLMAWFDLAAAPLVAGLIVHWTCDREHTRRLGRVVGVAAVIGCTLSGALAVGHELTNDALVVSPEDERLADLVATRTPPSAIVATGATYHDPVAMLSGRRVLMASTYMLGTHGIDVLPRARDVAILYAGGDPAEEVIARLGVTAVVIGPAERQALPNVDEAFFERRAQARYETDGRRLYVLAQR